MAKLRTNELRANRIIYLVCCGNIEKGIIIKEPYPYKPILDNSSLTNYLQFDYLPLDKETILTFIDRPFLSDFGVTDCGRGGRRGETLNAIFGSYKEAYQYINTETYKAILKEHKRQQDWSFYDLDDLDYLD